MSTSPVFCLLRRGRRAGLAALLLLTAFSAGAARANPILLDTFSRTGPLVGSTADTGQVWTGPGAFSTDGQELVVNSNNGPRIGGMTFLPNKTYELCLDVNVESGGQGWIAFGFTDTSVANAFDASPAAMHHRADPEIELFGSSSQQTIPAPGPFPKRLSVVLSTGPSLANSTVSFLENNTPIGVAVATDASAIDGVFIQANGGLGRVDNFMLTCVPEPSSAAAALVALGLVGVRSSRGRRG